MFSRPTGSENHYLFLYSFDCAGPTMWAAIGIISPIIPLCSCAPRHWWNVVIRAWLKIPSKGGVGRNESPTDHNTGTFRSCVTLFSGDSSDIKSRSRFQIEDFASERWICEIVWRSLQWTWRAEEKWRMLMMHPGAFKMKRGVMRAGRGKMRDTEKRRVAIWSPDLRNPELLITAWGY